MHELGRKFLAMWKKQQQKKMTLKNVLECYKNVNQHSRDNPCTKRRSVEFLPECPVKTAKNVIVLVCTTHKAWNYPTRAYRIKTFLPGCVCSSMIPGFVCLHVDPLSNFHLLFACSLSAFPEPHHKPSTQRCRWNTDAVRFISPTTNSSSPAPKGWNIFITILTLTQPHSKKSTIPVGVASPWSLKCPYRFAKNKPDSCCAFLSSGMAEYVYCWNWERWGTHRGRKKGSCELVKFIHRTVLLLRKRSQTFCDSVLGVEFEEDFRLKTLSTCS